MLLTWENSDCRGRYCRIEGSTFQAKNTTGIYPRLKVDAASVPAAAQAGGALLARASVVSGLAGALSAALAPRRRPFARHAPAKVLLDLHRAGAGWGRLLGRGVAAPSPTGGTCQCGARGAT